MLYLTKLSILTKNKILQLEKNLKSIAEETINAEKIYDAIANK